MFDISNPPWEDAGRAALLVVHIGIIATLSAILVRQKRQHLRAKAQLELLESLFAAGEAAMRPDADDHRRCDSVRLADWRKG